VSSNHRGPGAVRVDSIDVRVLPFQPIGDRIENVRDLRVRDN
jgi:hypothetical protein